MKSTKLRFLLAWLFALAAFQTIVDAQTASFTYQGRLTDQSATANGAFDFEFALFDANGVQIGTINTRDDVPVSNGIFTVQLNFGAAAFSGAARELEIRVRRGSENGAYTALSPRQSVTATPYAIRAISAATADTATNAQTLGGAAANQFVQIGDARLTDSRDPRAGSGNYIQNQNSAAQTAANFNISGTGAANIFNAQTQFNIGGNRILSNAGDSNLFAGVGAGAGNTGGISNSFFGRNAGNANTIGIQNSFFGSYAGGDNTTGGDNSFFGQDAGRTNTTGSGNSFFGKNAGYFNTTGGGNAFVGTAAGRTNTTGGNNVVIGTRADVGANDLNYAAAIGAGAIVNASNTVVLGRTVDTVQIPGNLNLTGTFTGNFTVPAANVTGILDIARIPNLDAAKITSGTFAVGRIPDLSASYIQNNSSATAQTSSNFNVSGTGAANIFNAQTQFNIGGRRLLSIGNNIEGSLFIGIGAGNSNTTGTLNTFVGRDAGLFNTTGNSNSFFGRTAGFYNTTGDSNSFFGRAAGFSNTTGFGNAFFGASAGQANTTGERNVFVGINAGSNNTTGNSNTLIGDSADVGANNLLYAAAIGAGATVNTSDTIVLGKPGGSYYGVQRPADTVQIAGRLTGNGFLARGGAPGFGGVNNNGYAFSGNAGDNDSGLFSLGGGQVSLHINAGELVRVTQNGLQTFGNISLNDNELRLREPSDAFHLIRFDSGINGMQFEAFDDYRWFNHRNNRVNMQLYANGNLAISGSYNQISDARYKTNVRTFDGALETVKRLRGVTFNWRPELNKTSEAQVGFIAQEVEAVLPALVSTDKEGYKSVAYANAVPVLVEAVKEQSAQIERQQTAAQNLQNQIESQNAQIETLRKQLGEIKRIVCPLKPDAAVCEPERK